MNDCRCAYCESVYGKDDDFKEFDSKPICDDCYISCMEEVIKDCKAMIIDTNDRHYTMNDAKGDLLHELNKVI